ncbi:unnamed protein product [Mytilus edulis]|uniref:Helicase ATP-binding domain-containing protein n=1 Tax=Mytilus edulis TaxID=6550 RepID=A0A8S3SKB6_MYTED|nr:unnamed protein product [Mytilus edulis]
MAILYINNYEDLVFEVDSDMFKEIQKTYGHNPSDVRLRSSIPECTGLESKETEANANESDVKQNYVSVSENYRKSTNNLSCPKEKHEDSMDELQDSFMSSLMSFDENNLRSRDETSEKNVFSTESAKPQVVDKDMSLSSDPLEREPNSLLYERINRDLAIAVSETPEEIQHNILQMPYDDVESDSDSEDETIPQKVLNLREYQRELAEPAKDGKNCLIVAPTGCGKTHVIMDIIQDHNSKMSRKGLIVKVAVLVEQQALAEQQAERCKEYLQPLRVKLITGEIHREEKLPKPLSSWLKRRDILVITSALLDNYLKSGDIKIEDFTLLVFDECHHAKDKHSYARVMHYYMDRKFDDNFPRERLPKVIGLTASVGVGKSNKIPGAKIHIKTTMANLDAEELVTVKKNRLELSEHVVVPEKDAKMFEGNDSILKAPTEKGSDAYTQWISRLRRETAQINEEARRYITTWRSYLNVYNEALIIYEDARVKDATNYLEDKMYDLNEGIIKNKIDDTMKHLYESQSKSEDGTQISQTNISNFTKSTSVSKYSANDASQMQITDALVSFVAGNLTPLSVVESPEFKTFVESLNPKYQLPSRKHLSTKLLHQKASNIQSNIKEKLRSAESVCLTIDLWSNRQMKGFLGITGHFILDWCMKSIMVSCKRFKGKHCAENIRQEYEEAVACYNIADKITNIITDNASNMTKAFDFSLPGYTCNNEEKNSKSDSEDENDESELEPINIDFPEDDLPKHGRCYAHTLQLVVRDGLKDASPHLKTVISKASNIVRYVRKSINASDILEGEKATS